VYAQRDIKWPTLLREDPLFLSFNCQSTDSIADHFSLFAKSPFLKSADFCYLFAVSNNPKKLRYDFHILIGMLGFIPEIVNSFVYFEVKTCSRWKWRSGDDLTMSAITEKEHFKKDA
jgi:hypothetical protein